jgi:hypothetical protein
MHRSDAIHVSVGTALLAVGVGSIIALLIYAASGPKTWPWCAAWFLASFGASVVFALMGAYFLIAMFAPLPLPTTRTQRESTPDLRIDGVHVDRTYQTFGDIRGGETAQVIFQVGFNNRGRGDVRNASVNVLIPGSALRFARTTQEGDDVSDGAIATTAETIEAGTQGTRYWHQNGLVFPGRTAVPMFFRATLALPIDTLRVVVRVVSSDLQNEIDESFLLSPPPTPDPQPLRRRAR